MSRDPAAHRRLYLVESLRERGRWAVEGIYLSRAVARRRRRDLANEQTPTVRIVVFKETPHV